MVTIIYTFSFLLTVYLLQLLHLRIHFVSSVDVKSSWEPLTSTKSAVELISFSFCLMNGMFKIRLQEKKNLPDLFFFT